MHNGQDYTFCIKNTVRLVVSEVWQLTCGKHVHDRIISLIRDVWIHKTCLAPPLFIYVYVPRQESEWSCICLQGVSIFLWFLYWILRFFRQCSIFLVSSFIVTIGSFTYVPADFEQSMRSWTERRFNFPVFLNHCPSKAPNTEKAQHDPHWPYNGWLIDWCLSPTSSVCQLYCGGPIMRTHV